MIAKKYLSLIKFSHTIFALPFAVIGFSLALYHGSSFSLKLLILVLLCMVFARSAAMAFNRYLDRDIDKLNPRTATREIPAGVISEKSALLFVIINSLLFIGTTWFINRLCFFLSPVALAVVLGYSYTKRFTPLCHFILGLGLSLAPVGAYLAVTGEFNLLPLLFSFMVLTWVSGFDIIYALQDEEFDRAHNLNSIPVLAGRKKALVLSRLLHFITATVIAWAGAYGNFSFFYWVGTALFTGLLIFQHTLIKQDDLSRVNLAFFTTNGIASVIFAAFTVAALLA